MRPTRARIPDELGLDAPENLNPATRAAAEATYRAELNPSRRAPRRQPCAPTSFAFGDLFTGKCAAANDRNED